MMKLNFLNKFFNKSFTAGSTKKGFTLAELMIVLAVLAVIAAVLMPTVFNSMPDENKLKFKKGYYTLKRTIDQMVNSDAYEQTEGQFGKVFSEDDTSCPFEGATNDDECARYFCIQFSEMLNSTYTQCEQFKNDTGLYTAKFDVSDITADSGNNLDSKCTGFPAAKVSDNAAAHLVNVATQDGIYWSVPKDSFSGKNANGEKGQTLTGVYSQIPAYYAVICMDVDGPGGEDAFAFGIRRDGKVIAGARAKQWLQEGTTTTVPTPEDD